MAVIRNDQYLHRPGAGRGAITPADPLEVLLYDGSGNPLLVKTPTGETRQALGVAGYGYDGTNWRPVKVNASGQAEVQLTGINAQDGTTGEAVSYVLDDNGRPVLRTVDAAPWAYDDHRDALRSVPVGGWEEEVMPMEYRKDGVVSAIVSVPDGIRGAIVSLQVANVDGEFDTNEGYLLDVVGTLGGGVTRTRMWRWTSKRHQGTHRSINLLVYPGAVPGDAKLADTTGVAETSIVGMPAVGGFHIFHDITGDFTNGEGVEGRVVVTWLY